MDWNAFITPILLSLKVAMISSMTVFVLAVLIAWLMTHYTFSGKVLIETMLMLPIVLPPTVIGFILLVNLGRRSWLGQVVEAVFGKQIVFTWWAAVIAAVVVSFPLVYQSLKAGFASVEKELMDVGRLLGANELQVLLYIVLPLARDALIAGYVLGFARSLGEFGATLMIAGNIPGKTQTLPTAIYLAVDAGKMQLAWIWTICIMFISFCMLLFIRIKNK